MKQLVIILSLSMAAVMSYAQPRITQEHKDRAADLVSKMTLEEKCILIHGDNKNSGQYDDGFHIMPIERLGIPAIRMADGPQGVRNKTNSTYYPCGIALAASFNRDVVRGVGEGIGFDAKARGVAIMLCPGVNIYRSPLCGRNFEYYGEDPYLAGETALQYINGIQSKGVMATIKHFAMNNQEYSRHEVSSNADERTINEIYFPTFRKAVQKADVACVMTSYNPINGVHAAESPWLIRSNLRAWGFEGIVMSDWTSTYSTMGCLTSGLDIEMPTGYVLNYEAVKEMIDNGLVDESYIDEKCRHILQTVIAYGFMDNSARDESIPLDYELSRANALAAAIEGPVMLKNEGLFPIKASGKNNIIVLGPNADIVPFGGGSGRMDPIEGRNISLYSGLKALGKGYKVTLMDWENPDMEAIAKASAVICAVGFNYKTETENSDRTYALPQGQDELISKVAAANANTAVVVYSGGEVDVNPWIAKVKTLIMAWYSGQEGGTALASIISGKTSPSGRLPFTFWGSEQANPCAANYHVFKGLEVYNKNRHKAYPYTEYKEGLFVGYRGVERYGITPMYPFGYGLTYSSFEYGDIELVPAEDGGIDVKFSIRNTGKREASEVAQVYVKPVGGQVLRPDHELKGYAKVKLAGGASAVVRVHLDADAFAHYDTSTHNWVEEKCDYDILVGASSQDIRFTARR